MKARLRYRKSTNLFMPDDPDSTDECRRTLNDDDVISFKLKKERNPKFHKKFMKLIGFFWLHIPEHLKDRIHSKEEARYALMMESGMTEPAPNISGKLEFKPLSVAFRNMDETQFSHVYQAVLDVVCRVLDTTRADVKSELQDFL